MHVLDACSVSGSALSRTAPAAPDVLPHITRCNLPPLTVDVAGCAAVLGENVIIPPSITQSTRGFWGVNGMTMLVCILVFTGILKFIRYKRLM